MLGPLPPLYRWVVCALALVVCAGLGAWIAWSLPIAMLAQTGAFIGAALGVLIVGVLVHDGEGRTPRRPR